MRWLPRRIRTASTWYTPERRNLDSLRRCRQQMWSVPDEVDGLCAAFDWFRYSAKHCPDRATAAAELRRVRDFLAARASKMDRIPGPGDYYDGDEVPGL